ncbi:E3 ubiquitin-protein ligase TRIM8-like isoform X2 [Heterodontus francisci]|uniref:E3 ubiquitin-protein ligase TRIM8-like isoform X2 n=1 Tax=Heterodontus francisci TaxID=7792 RepID=UPI00355B695A
MEKYNHSQPPADFAHITCDYCVEHPSPAAKTCLKCEASFCALHLKPHLIHKTLSLHTLIEPVADLRGLQCPDHKVVLQFYCKDDALCVCGCCITGKHRSHTLLSLDQAQAVIKEELERENKRLRELFQNCSIKQQDLAGLEADIKTRINELKGKLSKSFSEWRRQLEEDEEYTLKLIDEEGLRTLSQITNCSEALNKRMEQMTLIDGETQSLVQRDPLSFIQNSKQLLSRVTETQRVTDPDVPALTLNLSNISQLIQKRLNGCEKYHSDILGIIMSASTEYRGSSNITPSPHRSSGAALVPENVLQLSNGISGRAGISQGKSSLSLDPNTANWNLVLSDDLRSVTWTEQEQPYPPHPDSDPGLPHSDPSLLHTPPSLLHSDPGLPHSDPGLPHSDPGLLHTPPSLLHSDPDLQYSLPSLQHTPPDQNSEFDKVWPADPFMFETCDPVNSPVLFCKRFKHMCDDN